MADFEVEEMLAEPVARYWILAIVLQTSDSLFKLYWLQLAGLAKNLEQFT